MNQQPQAVPACDAEAVVPKVIITPKWEAKQFIPPPTEWLDKFPDPPAEELSPFDYFKMFIDDKIIEEIALQSNLYALQTYGVTPNFKKTEVEQYVGILLLMGIFPVAQYRMYWSCETKFSPIADVMSRNRFDQFRKYFHISDNTKIVPNSEPTHDRLFKIRPLLESLSEKLRQIPPEEQQSVDEQMIPYKGRSHMKQYIRGKPHKWGYKVFARCSRSGIMHDFSVFIGKGTCKDYGLGFSSNIVMKLVSDLPHHKNYKVFCDNWFTSLQLFKTLKDVGILAAGTIQANRTKKCPIASENNLKQKGRGSFDEYVDIENQLALVRWFDNKSILLLSSFVSTEPSDTCKRWSQVEKKKIDVQRPAVVQQYNKNMGGVDLSDMLIELYRINLRSKRGYLRIVYWCLNVAVVNGWLLYRRHQTQKQSPIAFSLVQFQSYIANALCKADKFVNSERKRGRPLSNSPSAAPQVKRGPKCQMPINDVRFDRVDHFPEPVDNKGRCKLCKTGYSRITCTKCKVHLCLVKTKNCFTQFHVK